MSGVFAGFEAICLVLSFALLRPGRAPTVRALIRLHAASSALALLAAAAAPVLPAPPDGSSPGIWALRAIRVLAALLLALQAFRFVPLLRDDHAPRARAARSAFLATGPLLAAGLALTALAVLVVTAGHGVPTGGGVVGGIGLRAALPAAREILAIGIALPLLSLLGLLLPGDEVTRAARLLPLGNGLVLLAASLADASPAMLVAPAVVMPCLVLAADAIVRRAAVLPDPG